ncbi:hypothetical protein BO78DRAFT_9830 [Aspergillus sclerotiicarbonarius CBS 121057]|uniref:Uncharacterized protein n=1 Tax=Aspergillus sclerotiicarbonarius (strain CBS 121057 / IBT 28362) TaxID=1448318 RepID=A0A319EJP1_ASPSB|nr:hypothetical protein BO78DRAFT_9830 [Aspergillus sclerotiicarbonarius CBS 121057]
MNEVRPGLRGTNTETSQKTREKLVGMAEKVSRVRVTVGVMLRSSDLIAAAPDAKPDWEFSLPNSNILSGRQVTSTGRPKGPWGTWFQCVNGFQLIVAFLLRRFSPPRRSCPLRCWRRLSWCRFFQDSSALDHGPMLVF